MTLPDSDSFDTLGGAKSDYAPVEDPTTDRSATEMNTALADVSMLTRMIDRAWVIFAVDPTQPTLISHDALWGNSNAVAPVVAHTGTGVFTLTWTATQQNPLGESKSLNFKLAHAEIDNAAITGFVHAVVTDANVVTVYTYNTSFAANNLNAGTHVKVFVK